MTRSQMPNSTARFNEPMKRNMTEKSVDVNLEPNNNHFSNDVSRPMLLIMFYLKAANNLQQIQKRKRVRANNPRVIGHSVSSG